MHTFLCQWDPLQVLTRRSDERAAAMAQRMPRSLLSQQRRAKKRGGPVAMSAAKQGGGAPQPEWEVLQVEVGEGEEENHPESNGLHADVSEEVREALHRRREARAAGGSKWRGIDALRGVCGRLEGGLVEREGEAKLLLLALVGGEHLLLLGPPGTAKSELCRRLSRVAGFSYFERTLTRFSMPEELFGPLSLKVVDLNLIRALILTLTLTFTLTLTTILILSFILTLTFILAIFSPCPHPQSHPLPHPHPHPHPRK